MTAALATQHGDVGIAVLCHVHEALAHLKAMKPDGLVKVQACLAQAAAYQLHPIAHSPAVAVLLDLVGLFCSVQQKNPAAAAQNMQRLTLFFNNGSNDGALSGETLVPIKRHAGMSPTVSAHTATIIRSGQGASDEFDYLVVTVPDRIELRGLM
jgi:hypothetical protein